MKDVLVTDFSGALEVQGFLPWLREQGISFEHRNWRGLEGTHCYCDGPAREQILADLPERLPRLRWIDSGDYHYMSCLLALRETKPFHLVLLDHHPDNQEAAFGGILSCGGWVKTLQEEQSMLKDVLKIGPEGCPEAIPAGWLAERRGERVYVSLDKDILDTPYARTGWSQGAHTPEQMKEILGQLMDGMVEVIAVDICGEMSPEACCATPEDQTINKEINIELYKFITTHLK